jgi:hypothetical protein
MKNTKQQPSKPDKLTELLETPDRAEQVARVTQLKALAGAPVLTLAIQADTRTGRVTLHTVGVNVPIAAAYAMLDEARKLLIEEERKALGAQAQPAPPADA